MAGRCAYGFGTGEAIDTLGYLFCRERVVFVDALEGEVVGRGVVVYYFDCDTSCHRDIISTIGYEDVRHVGIQSIGILRHRHLIIGNRGKRIYLTMYTRCRNIIGQTNRTCLIGSKLTIQCGVACYEGMRYVVRLLIVHHEVVTSEVGTCTLNNHVVASHRGTCGQIDERIVRNILHRAAVCLAVHVKVYLCLAQVNAQHIGCIFSSKCTIGYRGDRNIVRTIAHSTGNGNRCGLCTYLNAADLGIIGVNDCDVFGHLRRFVFFFHFFPISLNTYGLVSHRQRSRMARPRQSGTAGSTKTLQRITLIGRDGQRNRSTVFQVGCAVGSRDASPCHGSR